MGGRGVYPRQTSAHSRRAHRTVARTHDTRRSCLAVHRVAGCARRRASPATGENGAWSRDAGNVRRRTRATKGNVGTGATPRRVELAQSGETVTSRASARGLRGRCSFRESRAESGAAAPARPERNGRPFRPHGPERSFAGACGCAPTSNRRVVGLVGGRRGRGCGWVHASRAPAPAARHEVGPGDRVGDHAQVSEPVDVIASARSPEAWSGPRSRCERPSGSQRTLGGAVARAPLRPNTLTTGERSSLTFVPVQVGATLA